MTAPEGMAAMERIQAIGAAVVLTVLGAALVAKPWLAPWILKKIQSKGDAHHAQNHTEN